MAEKDSLGFPEKFITPTNVGPGSNDTDAPDLFYSEVEGRKPRDPQGLMPEQGSRKK